MKLPIVIMSVNTFFANTLLRRQVAAHIEPAIVTLRQPYLFTNVDEIGPRPATQNRKIKQKEMK